jgi:bifunctional non-homologous end joining protein LigD
VTNMMFGDTAPMLSTSGSVAAFNANRWAFEGKHDGYRMMIEANHGVLRLRMCDGRDASTEYPQLRSLADDLAAHHVILDGEVVGVDDTDVPRFSLMQQRSPASRIEFWAFDVLYLDGHRLLRVKYSDRRRLLETLAGVGELRGSRTAPR